VRIGIDVGGTKIEGLLLGDDGREIARLRVATPTAYGDVLAAIAELTHGLEARGSAGRATIGVGTPGFLQPGRGAIRNSNLLSLNDRPLDKDLEAALGRPVRLANDAKCFVLSEAIDGAAAPPNDLDRTRPDVVFGATLGTGVGGGIVVDGRVLTGENALGGGELRGEEIGRRAEAGDDQAGRAFALYEDRLARALASVINLIDPRVIVLGGGVSNNVRIFGNVPKRLERYTVAQELRTKLVHAAHGDASGVRGAAWLWPATTMEP
jgi:fructokinase